MKFRDELLKEIQSRLTNNLKDSYKNRAEASDLFELFIFNILLDAAINEGAKLPIYFEDTSGKKSSQLLFRRSPGYINDKNLYTHAVLQLPSNDGVLELEAHIGIYAVGASGVPQECDIAVLYRDEGQRCRLVKDKV